MSRWSPKATTFWPLFVTVVCSDYFTKRLAEALLITHLPHPVWGNVVRFTLGYNPGAAMSMSLGAYSRYVFAALTVGALVACIIYYRRTAPDNRLAAAAIGCIAGGALGNLLDRIRSAAGVVDFIDIGIGNVRFWTFNVADAALTCGAILLALVLSREGRTAPS